tara:strand:- start:720 stop:2099 length:1380 start_codon:yes stop_codon:yes gene_type:complete
LKNILIYGVGQASKKLSMEIIRSGINVKGIIANNYKKKSFNNIPIYKENNLGTVTKRDRIDTIIFAVPSINNKKKIEILNKLKINNIDLLTLNDEVILKNHVGLKDINEIEPELILKKKLIKNKINKNKFKNQTILITGGCGSIGRALTEKIVRYKPKKVIINDLSEFGIYKLSSKIKLILKKYNLKTKVKFIIGNLTNKIFVKNCLASLKIDYVFHCAAYKHVDIIENNILEGYFNNINSTSNLLEFFRKKSFLKSFLLVSTDKAYNSKNVMGATKRVCEKLVILSNENKKNQKFKVVRFGNVFASDGSAIPKIFNQIRNNEKVTITDLKMERYFLTMNEACELIISVSTFRKKKGDIMFFKMGEPIKIINIANKISQYFDKKIKVKIIGLRKGEKMREKLHFETKKINTSNSNIYGIKDKDFISNTKMTKLLSHMKKLYEGGEAKKLKNLLLEFSNK